jgi:hypothetical protein
MYIGAIARWYTYLWLRLSDLDEEERRTSQASRASTAFGQVVLYPTIGAEAKRQGLINTTANYFAEAPT